MYGFYCPILCLMVIIETIYGPSGNWFISTFTLVIDQLSLISFITYMHISIIDMFFLHVKLNCNAIIWFGSYLWPWNIFAMFSPDWFLLQISIGMVQLEALFEPLLDLCSLENVSWWTTFFPPSFGKILINNPMLFTCSLFDWSHEWGFTLRNSIVEFI